ncbi:transcriptional regulator, DeoR family [Geoalkalibacter ferrihydriticus]|uniref:DeoR faimly transcriptional regulator n=2 Tax=Geoalkalibacter ferrihydriticus TaxID=392333 RepID=A0A0C2EFR3_9BACT|nr:DeoR family transcriptional regulator [Geoalkalibacter ferrihydriticus]KIH77463.1 DeoR faimly transcriptional regulator [Geoalkalibacter ferrihydriticus DSM 17813]SDM14023.1 transcriptional regulator, DeoR family [Geoalkalibacter ferrihydriticus]
MTPHPPALTPRQQQIMELAQQQKFVATEDLVKAFDVTPQTIRRDINELCALGLLRRYHGGAGLASSVENVDYQARQVLCLEEKRRIAALVARNIPDRASIFINIGTTTEEVAKALRDHEGLRVITNNLHVAALLSANPSFEITIAGGIVRPRDGGIIGEATIDFIRQFKVDYGIIGISGIDRDGSLLDYDYREVKVAQAIIENSRRIFLVADHTKFGRSALVRVNRIDAIDALFTDAPPPREIAALLAREKIALHVAGGGAEEE